MIETAWAFDSLGVLWKAYVVDGVVFGWIGSEGRSAHYPVGELIPVTRCWCSSGASDPAHS